MSGAAVRPLTLAIDAMGGDRAPMMVIEGMNRAVDSIKNVRFLLFGRSDEVAPLVQGFRRLRTRVELRHATDVIAASERPSTALRGGRNSSMRQAIDAVAAGEADGVVSAGNTGALMAMAKFVFKTLPGVDRPAIASVFPSLRGRTVLLDLGANVNCGADNLVQFAVMGEVFARNVLGLQNPSVGLLNVGEEDLKGNDAVKKAAAILQQSKLAIRFHGFVEGDDIAMGTVDVVVTDGFSGNIALKTAEGTARLYTHYLKRALISSPLARLGALLAGPALRKMRARFDPRLYNGAMFLGLNGICVKSHGGTDAFGFCNAIRVAAELVSDGVNDGIKQDFAFLSAGPAADPKLAIG
ncbi:MAG: phosphate acyltransferase PlsX [Rhodospirillales bacterium]|nr:phosphate acyltransferase PlsX [Rhodospirillales bacterium]